MYPVLRVLKVVLVTVGTRPEAIKMAPVIRELRAFPKEFSTIVCSSGQHQGMMDSVLSDFSIQPDIRLEGSRRDGNLANLTSSLLTQMQDVLRDVGPSLTLVQGDTTTALSAAMASFYAGVPVAHIEAGLRTRNLQAPFPEEFNRRAISIVSSVHFAPTQSAASNLQAEGIDTSTICVTGNTVIDALLLMRDQILATSNPAESLQRDIGPMLVPENPDKRFVLITTHRRENLDSGIRKVCEAVASLAGEFPNLHFVFPVHPNPVILEEVTRALGGIGNVHLLGPLSYRHFVYLLMSCFFVITDSGGIQEEAPSLGKPVLVLRDSTERPEGVVSGSLQIVGTEPIDVVRAARELILDQEKYSKMSRAHNPYGDGDAAKRVVSRLRSDNV